MRSICLFASYFTSRDIPYYITVYLKELKKQFKEVVLLTSQEGLSRASLDFLDKEKISFFVEENKGFDFGLWYHAFQKLDLEAYDQVALVNDSCILFKSLDEFMLWAKTNAADLKGITQSESIYPHLQSYFLVLNKKAVELTYEYFKENKVLEDISDVILVYEVGLSRFLQEKGLTISAFIDNNGYKGEFSPYYKCVDYHLAKGIPMIKKKIIFASYRKAELFTLARMDFNIDPAHYLGLIAQNNKDLVIDINKLKDQASGITPAGKIKYTISRILIKVFRPIYKTVKGA